MKINMNRTLAAIVLGLGIAGGPQLSAEEDADFLARRLLAEQGFAEAQFTLARNYAAGKGVPQDDAEAVMWFSRAAEQGHVMTQ